MELRLTHWKHTRVAEIETGSKVKVFPCLCQVITIPKTDSSVEIGALKHGGGNQRWGQADTTEHCSLAQSQRTSAILLT